MKNQPGQKGCGFNPAAPAGDSEPHICRRHPEAKIQARTSVGAVQAEKNAGKRNAAATPFAWPVLRGNAEPEAAQRSRAPRGPRCSIAAVAAPPRPAAPACVSPSSDGSWTVAMATRATVPPPRTRCYHPTAQSPSVTPYGLLWGSRFLGSPPPPRHPILSRPVLSGRLPAPCGPCPTAPATRVLISLLALGLVC